MLHALFSFSENISPASTPLKHHPLSHDSESLDKTVPYQCDVAEIADLETKLKADVIEVSPKVLAPIREGIVLLEKDYVIIPNGENLKSP